MSGEYCAGCDGYGDGETCPFARAEGLDRTVSIRTANYYRMVISGRLREKSRQYPNLNLYHAGLSKVVTASKIDSV